MELRIGNQQHIIVTQTAQGCAVVLEVQQHRQERGDREGTLREIGKEPGKKQNHGNQGRRVFQEIDPTGPCWLWGEPCVPGKAGLHPRPEAPQKQESQVQVAFWDWVLLGRPCQAQPTAAPPSQAP